MQCVIASENLGNVFSCGKKVINYNEIGWCGKIKKQILTFFLILASEPKKKEEKKVINYNEIV
jgi:hypothetical protein